jgi:O-antigen ligase
MESSQRVIRAISENYAGGDEQALSPLTLGLFVGLATAAAGIVLAFGGPIAAVAVALAGIASFAVLRKLEIGFWGVIGVVCLLPFATLPVDIGLTPTLLDLALAAVVGMWVLRIATGRRQRFAIAPITAPLVMFIIVAVFSFIFGLNNGPLTSNLLRHFAELVLSISFVLVVIDYCSEMERLERLVKMLLLAGAAAALISIGLWVMADDTANTILNLLQRIGYPGGWVIRYIEENPDLSERAIGTSVDPNVLGGLLLMIGALAGPQLVSRRALFPRWQVFAISGVTLVGLILTFSRGAMLGVVAGLGFTAIVRYRRLVPYLLVAAAVILLLPTTQGYVGRFIEGFQGQDLATQMRFGEYRDALTLIGRYPIFGVGFAGTPDVDTYLGVSNVYLTIAQTMGLVGLLFFLSVMAVMFGYAYFNRNHLKDKVRLDAIWLGLHSALIGGLAAGIFDHYLFNLDFHHAVTLFWLLVGLATAATRLGLDDSGPAGPIS